ncbi:MAG: Putative DNA-binding protein [Candidatus Tokpelaia hoelldobleri]|uniref:DNA-binding protein n=1 Tax=Candidatus Tokpelaia hoelldobleri TaxID=1902579 RepID=A0A1U9JWS5_9HYPH|nr:MAG: Putative DNA-binding protein [Candidatus Tokpelaia hoelldoblerii]
MSKAGSRILQGAREALSYAKGKADNKKFGVHIPPEVDVKRIRQKIGLTQAKFASRFGFSTGRIRDWEQGRHTIDASSRVLLTVIEQEPEAVERALKKAKAA